MVNMDHNKVTITFHNLAIWRQYIWTIENILQLYGLHISYLYFRKGTVLKQANAKQAYIVMMSLPTGA